MDNKGQWGTMNQIWLRLPCSFGIYYTDSMDNNGKEKCVLFTGSSIIEYWTAMEQDLAPLSVVNRGMAGVRISKIRARIKDFVRETQPAAVVVYAGSNDLSGENPPKAGYILGQFEKIVNFSREIVPDISVMYISIAPSSSPLRTPHQPLIDEANRIIREYCESLPGLGFCDIRSDLTEPDGTPRMSCFLEDGIHLTREGYQAVSGTVKRAVSELFL